MLAQALVGKGVTVSNVKVTGADGSRGFFSGGVAAGIGIQSGIVLSSGKVTNAIGPNTNSGISANNDGAGSTDLDTLIPGYSTLDAATLEFDFEVVSTALSFQYVFASEEYNEYVGSSYNDVFAFFVDGVNIALVPGTATAVAINNVNKSVNGGYYRNNSQSDFSQPPFNTQADGFTSVLQANVSLGVGKHTIKLAIADAGDRVLDSWVFLSSGSFVSGFSDLKMTAAPVPTSLLPDQDVTLVYTMTNVGTSEVTGAVVQATLPNTLQFVGVTTGQGTATGTGGAVVANLGTLAPGAVVQVSVAAKAIAVGPFSVHAFAQADQIDIQPGDNVVTVTSSVIPPNAEPTDILLSAQTVAENRSSGTVVGTLTSVDPNAGDTFTYSLVAGDGATDNSSFTISGNELRTAASFDFESKASYSIRVRSTDQGGLFTEKVFTIAVTDVVEGPPSRPVFTGPLTLVGVTRVSASGGYGRPSFSPDGSKLAFASDVANLVPDDTNGEVDIFVQDLSTGAITRVSTDSSGAECTGASMYPAFSSDGSRVLFMSWDSNLVPGDTNEQSDIFVKDLLTGAITAVSTSFAGVPGHSGSYWPVFSPDGSRVAFTSAASNLLPEGGRGIFVKDLFTGAVTLVSTDASGESGNAESTRPSFSPDGLKVTFASGSSNLVPGDTNGTADIFVKDLVTGAIMLVSADANGAWSNGYSGMPIFTPDGSKSAFASKASTHVSGDTKGTTDLFVKDHVTGSIARVSTDSVGAQADSSSASFAFSPDGTKLVFLSFASNLVSGDTNGYVDIFMKDLVTGAITRVSTDAYGGEGNSDSLDPVFSPDGTSVAFQSGASNLVPGDTNNNVDVFVAALGFALSVVEGTSAVATLDATDPADAEATLAYSISGADAARFTIDTA
ncbi:MAG: choice-of-anchor L domain-containing protein, partial [Planctomycetia bacterium]